MAPPFAVNPHAADGLPAFIATHRLQDDALLGSPRFTPRTDAELFSAIFAKWNFLDALMYSTEPTATFQTGYLRELQLRRMVQLARQEHVRTYVEVGMNGGHSLTAMLLANPRLEAHVFDLFKWQYSWPAAKLINTTFSGRVHFYPGWSHMTLPLFTERLRAEQRTCELMLVDGGHTFRAARAAWKGHAKAEQGRGGGRLARGS